MALGTLGWAIWLASDGDAISPLPVFRVVSVVLGVLLLLLYALRDRAVSKPFLVIQLALDVVVVSVLAEMSGGLHSFFILLYFPTIGAGAYLLRRPGAFLAAVFTSVGFLAMLVAHHGFGAGSPDSAAVSWSEIMFHIFAFFLMAGLTGHLSDLLARTGAALEVEKESSRDLATEHDTVLDRVHAGVVSTNADGIIVALNPFASILLGDVMGQPLLELLPGLGPKGDIVWEERRPDGQRWVCTVADLPRGGRVVVLEDTTELARMRETKRQDERMVEAGRLAASLAHEVRNPLASLSGSLQLIREEHPSRLADLALNEADRLNRLVGDFLDMSRRPVVVHRPVDVHAIATEVCEAFTRDVRYADRVGVRCEGTSIMADADPDRVRQALWNLLLNGAQAMPRGGQVTVSVLPAAPTSARAAGVEIVVSDEGVGILPEERDRMFDPFYTTRSGGTGLGLLLVERIVSGHGGHVEVSAGDSRGTRFNLWLPREAPLGT